MSVNTAAARISRFAGVLALYLCGVAGAQPLDPLDFASLGTLHLAAGNYTIDTDTLTIYDNAAPGLPLFTGVADDQGGMADTFGGVWDPVGNPGQLGIPEIAVFTFDGINLDPIATVTITGTRAIALLSQGDANIGTSLSVDGRPNGIDLTEPPEVYDGTPSLPSPGGFAGGTPTLGSYVGFFNNQPGQEGYFIAGDGPGAGDSIPIRRSDYFGEQGSAGFGGTGIAVRPFNPAQPNPAPYGDLTQTLQGGSGGGSSVATVVPDTFRVVAITGGSGGGAIEIGAVGNLVIDAEVSARGGLVSDPPGVSTTTSLPSGGQPGGGSGGGIRVHGERVTLNASLVADASARQLSSGPITAEGLGGGGRIFVLNRQTDIEREFVLGQTTMADLSYFDNLSAKGTSGVLTVTPALSTVPAGQTASLNFASQQMSIEIGSQDYIAEFFVTNTRILSGGQADIGTGATNRYSMELAGPTARIIGAGSLINENEVHGTGRVEVPLTNATGAEVNAVSDTLIFTQSVANSSGGAINAISSTLSFEAGLISDGDLNLINSTVNGDVVNNGVVALAGTSTFTGTVSGSGTFIGGGTAAFAGTFAPGESPGLVAFENDLVLQTGAALAIEIGGTTPGAEYDRVEVGGFATLRGTLQVSLLDGYTPAVGDSYAFLFANGGYDASFEAVTLPDLSAEGLAWELSPGGATLFLEAVPALDGDFNLDGRIDAADYTVWRDGLGTKFTPGDYDVWVSNYGATVTAPANAVPEPTARLLVLFVGLACWFSRRN